MPGKSKVRPIQDTVVADAIAMVAEGRAKESKGTKRGQRASRAHALKTLPKTRENTRPTCEEAENVVLAQEQFLKERWTRFIGLLQEGALVNDALDACKFPKYALQGILKTNKELSAQYHEAKIVGLWQEHKLDVETVEDIMADIALGETMIAACEKKKVKAQAVTRLCLKDPMVQGMYDDAQVMRMENMSYELLDIADDDTQDMGQDAKGGDRPNTARVQRDRLKSDNRKWLMARLNHRKFGDRIKQDVEQTVIVNHVEKLDAARRRKEKLNNARKQTT